MINLLIGKLSAWYSEGARFESLQGTIYQKINMISQKPPGTLFSFIEQEIYILIIEPSKFSSLEN